MHRWVLILETLSDGQAWGVRELARATGIPRSAVHRSVHEMSVAGLLSTDDLGGPFRVGPTLTRIAALVAANVDVRRIGRSIIEKAGSEIGETVVLTVYDPRRRQFAAVDAAETRHTIRYIWEALRDWNDLHLGASGKGILAFLPESDRESILAGLPDPLPGPQRRSHAALRAELATARQRGYAISHGERYEGAIGVSVPYRDGTGAVAGDLIGTWPDNRTSQRKEVAAAATLVSAGDELSRALGCAI
jgi:DNA-binding IclR family transcriptional regulator